MGVFSRLRDIIQSNINAMLEKAEDPQKLIKLMIQEMEDTLVEIKASCAGAMAQVKKVERELETERQREREWEARAELAVRKGRDDLAREALLQKRVYVARAEALENEVAESKDVVDRYKHDIEALEEKLQSAREKHRILVARHRRAQQSRKARETMRRADHHDVLTRVERFENRIDRMEAAADLVNHGARRPTSLHDEFAALEGADEVEEELAAVKARVAGKAEATDQEEA